MVALNNTKAIYEEIVNLTDRASAIQAVAKAESRDFTAEEATELDSLLGTDEKPGQIANLQKQHERCKKIEDAQKAIAANRIANQFGGEAPTQQPVAAKEFKIPARAKAPVKHFKSAEEAYAMGQWVAATLYNVESSKRWIDDYGGIYNAMSTRDNTKGGFLVPEPLEASIIELREQFGVFRQNSTVYPLSGGVINIPKLTGEITYYYIGEEDPATTSNITASDLAIGQVRLESKTLAAFMSMSREVNSDAAISLAEMFARSVASRFAYAEDDAGFNGDGGSSYGGITGLKNALLAGSQITATSNTTFSALTLANFEAVVGQIKRYPGMMPKWYIHSVGFANSMQRLVDAGGGNTNITLGNGAMQSMFLGYPVVFTQVLPSATTSLTGQLVAYFGDLGMTTYLGNEAGLAIDASSEFYFKQNALALRATQRYDIVCHDVGTASASGGIVGLKMG